MRFLNSPACIATWTSHIAKNGFTQASITERIGCQWRGVPQPELQVQLDSVQARIDALTKQVVCSSYSGGHSGRFCEYRSDSRDRALAPRKPCGKFHAGLCKRGDKC
jgi:hypothetical protein